MIISIHIPRFSGKGAGCDHGKIPCSPFWQRGLVVVVVTAIYTLSFSGQKEEVVVIISIHMPSFSGKGKG